MGSRKKVNYSLLKDYLKLYRRNESELERLAGIVKSYSDDKGMWFGLDKCDVLVMEKGV